MVKSGKNLYICHNNSPKNGLSGKFNWNIRV